MREYSKQLMLFTEASHVNPSAWDVPETRLTLTTERLDSALVPATATNTARAGLAPNADSKIREEQRQPFTAEQTLAGAERCYKWKPEPRICRGFDGLPNFLDGSISPIATETPNRTNRLKALGNAVVPQQAYPIFKAIMEADTYDELRKALAKLLLSIRDVVSIIKPLNTK